MDGKYFKKLRTEAGLTQAELAARVKVSRETVLANENNRDGSIDNIRASLIRDWKHACRNVPESVMQEFIEHLKYFFNIE